MRICPVLDREMESGHGENEMKQLYIIVCVAAVAGIALVSGCSKEDRDEAMNRLSKAGKALNGEVRPDDKEHETPNVVAEQQRKERIRQNTKWTPENQAKFPVEYCQAMLEQVDKDAKQYEIIMHKCLTAKSAASRKISEDAAQLKTLETFLSNAKTAYRAADAENNWPAMVNGFALSKEKLQEKIVDASDKIKAINSRQTLQTSNLTKLDRKVARVAEEQKKLMQTKESLQRTLDNLHLKDVIDSEDGISSSVAAINDALGALGNGEDDISLDDLSTPDKASATQDAFNAIMME